MISNSSPPRTTPLTPLNNSPFSRGSRAVHQGQKKAKAYNISIAEADCEMSSGLSNDEGKNINNGQLTKSLGETSPTQTCDSTSLTPISKGILKRKREAEMEPDDGNGVTCSKKKVIFADPISATKLIEARKINMKSTRKRRLRYEDQTEGVDGATNELQPETEAVDKLVESEVITSISQPIDIAVNNPDSENSDPVIENTNAKQAKVDGKVRKAVKNINPSSNRDTGKLIKESVSSNQMVKEPTLNVAAAEKMSEHSNVSKEFEKNNLDLTPKDANGNSDKVFSELESLLQAIESPSADKESSSSNQVDLTVVDGVITESQTKENDYIKPLLIVTNTKSDNTDEKENSGPVEESLPLSIDFPETAIAEVEQSAEINQTQSPSSPRPVVEQAVQIDFTTKEKKEEKIEEIKSEMEEVNPTSSKPLLESWVNVKKSVDLFIQSYCTMLTSKMRNWLSVKGINTIGDFANLVETSSDRLTESPICPLNEETILSTFHFMIEQELNKESSSVEVNEMIKDDRGDLVRDATVKELKNIHEMVPESVIAKVQRLSTLKVVMPVLPLEIPPKINPDTPSSGEYFDAPEEISPSKLNSEMDCSGTKIALSEEDLNEGLVDSKEKIPKKSKTITSSTKDTSKKISLKRVSSVNNQAKNTPNKGKGTAPKKTQSIPKKSIAKNVPIEAEKSETISKDSPVMDSPVKISTKKDSESLLACKGSVYTSRKIEFELQCKPHIDPATIIPRASIVIKRLTDDEIIRLSRPKITFISVEIPELASSEEKDDTQLTKPTPENKEGEEPIKPIDSPLPSPPPSSSSPSSSSPPSSTTKKDESTKGSLSIQHEISKPQVESSPLRKSRRKRDSELPAIHLSKSTRTRRRTVGLKV